MSAEFTPETPSNHTALPVGAELAPSGSPAQPMQELSYWQRVRSLYNAGAEDYRNGGPAQKIGLIATAAWMAYEWGPGNEAVTPVVGGQLMNHTHGWGGVVTTAAVTGGFTFAQQVAAGSTVAKTASTFPQLAERAFELTGNSEEVSDDGSWLHLSKGRQAAYAFSLGSSFVVTREAVKTGQTEATHLYKQATRSAAIAAGGVTIVAGTVDAAATTLRHTPAEHVVNIGVDIISNPITWLGGFSLAAVANRIHHHRQRND